MLAVPLAFGILPAFAQGNPSADQIIRLLTPTPDSMAHAKATRGIHPVTAPDQNPTAAPRPSAGPREAANLPAVRPPASVLTAPPPSVAQPVNLTVNFASGSADLTPEARQSLDELGRALSSSVLANYRFRVEGHTDTVGSRSFNRTLSERRAEAVVAYIASKFGVAASRMQAIGMGEDGLLVQTPDQTDEPRNRRVQVLNLGS
jgi:outer membrane protein OmpA-like peptidoglycan-associated protein